MAHFFVPAQNKLSQICHQAFSENIITLNLFKPWMSRRISIPKEY
jgi:hypothetical protein